MNAKHLLSQARFFEGITPEHRQAVADVCATTEFRKGDTLFVENAEGAAFYLLVKGQVQLHKLSPDGHEVVIKLVGPGEVFAEVILFEQTRYPVTALALTDGLALKILRRDLHRLLEDSEFRNDFIATLMRKQRYLADRIRQITSANVEDRFFSFLHEHYGREDVIDVDITKKEIAAAIGTTPESLSRLIAKLKKQKRLSWEGRTIRIRRGG